MKPMAVFVALCALGVLSSYSLRAQTLTDSDRTSIEKLITAVPVAMNRKDWRAFGELFTEDADWINVVGMFWHGKKNVVKAHAAYASTAFRNGGFGYSDLSIRDVAPNVALVVVTEHSNDQVAPDGSKLPAGQGRLSYLVVKRKGTWKISFGHNTGINLQAQRYDPINGHWQPATSK